MDYLRHRTVHAYSSLSFVRRLRTKANYYKLKGLTTALKQKDYILAKKTTPLQLYAFTWGWQRRIQVAISHGALGDTSSLCALTVLDGEMWVAW